MIRKEILYRRAIVGSLRPLVDLKNYRIAHCDPLWMQPPSPPPLSADVFLIICGFGSQRYQLAANRLAAQARGLGRFTEILVFTDLSNVPGLSPARRIEIEELAKRHPRGWGLWSWKPAVVSAVMNGLPEGVEVFYVDAGCEISPWGEALFDRWRCHLQTHGNLFFSIPYLEREWTTPAVLRYFALPYDLDSLQVQATWFALLNLPAGRILIERWAVACLHDGGRLLQVTEEDENKYLIEHREDQSVLSCLIRSQGAFTILPHADHFLPELYLPNSWILRMPIHTLRLTGSRSFLETLLKRSSDLQTIFESTSIFNKLEYLMLKVRRTVFEFTYYPYRVLRELKRVFLA